MDYLSEQNIQHNGLQFLKAYYKQRERGGETIVSQDLITPEGVVADGYLTFPLPDGKPFIATMEATSIDKIDEVRFRNNYRLMIWEGFAFACLVTAFLMGLAFANQWVNLWEAGWFQTIVMANTILLCIWIVYQIFFRNLLRYRYIYAIEQFKQYYADEQWIAIGEDVFPVYGDLNLEELKRQCVNFGFGLIQVQRDETVLMLITPARVELFKGNRKLLSFFKMEHTASFLKNIKLLEKLRVKPRLSVNFQAVKESKLVKSLADWSPGQLNETIKVNYNRYMQSYWQQKLLSAIAFLIVCTVFYSEYQRRPMEYVSGKKYESLMSNKAQTLEKQGEEYLLEKAYTVPYSSETSAYIEPAKKEEVPAETVDNPSPGLYLSSDNGYVSYECERLNLTGDKYIVQDGVFRDFKSAKERISLLNQNGYVANCISLDCISNRKGYIVFYELFYNNKENAMTKAVKVKKSLQVDGLGEVPINVVKLSFE